MTISEFTMDLPDLTNEEIQLIVWGLQHIEESHPDAKDLLKHIKESWKIQLNEFELT